MTSIILPERPRCIHLGPDHEFETYSRQVQSDELSLEKRVLEINEKLIRVLRGFKASKIYLENRDHREAKYFGEVNEHLYNTLINVFLQYNHQDERTVLGNKIARIGLVGTLAELYECVANVTCKNGLTEEFVKDSEDDGVHILLSIRRIFSDFSSVSGNVCKRLSETNIHTSLLADLHRIHRDGLPQFEKYASAGGDIFVFSSSLGILYNVVKHPHTEKDRLRKSASIERLAPFLKSQFTHIQLTTVLLLSYISIEGGLEKVLQEVSFNVFDFMIDTLNEAILAKDRRAYGYDIPELIDGLTALVQCHRNKSSFMNKHPLTLIMGLLEAGNQSEMLPAIKFVWELSFCPENRHILRKNEDLLYVLDYLKHGPTHDIRTAAQRTVFVIDGEGRRMKDVAPVRDVKNGHIMISYSRGDQAQAIKIFHALRADGHPVWIDVVEMNKYSDILDGVTRAVEQSSLVLVCFSEKYVRDQNCRTEAEYAFALKKRVIALKLQGGYVPVGWLTAVIGSRFYLTFTNDGSFEKQLNTLREYVQGHGTTMTMHTPGNRCQSRGKYSRGPSRAMSRSTSRGPSRGSSHGPVYEKKVEDWEEEDIMLWASQSKLEGRAWKTASKMSVPQILYVYTMWKTSPETFYGWAECMINLGSIEDLMRFRSAIKSLTGYV